LAGAALSDGSGGDDFFCRRGSPPARVKRSEAAELAVVDGANMIAPLRQARDFAR
jgi:hypothetical protein